MTYSEWMALPWDDGDVKPALPAYLIYAMPRKVVTSMARFRTSSHQLGVETGRWQNIARQDRRCNLCDSNAVQDEMHVLMECPALDDLRELVSDRLAVRGADMHELMLSKDVDCLARFVHECMKCVDAYGVEPEVDVILVDGEQPE